MYAVIIKTSSPKNSIYTKFSDSDDAIETFIKCVGSFCHDMGYGIHSIEVIDDNGGYLSTYIQRCNREE